MKKPEPIATSIDVYIVFKRKKPPVGLSHHAVHVTVYPSEMVEVIKSMEKSGYKVEVALRRTKYELHEKVKL